MITIRNICNEVGVGAFYHSASYSPTSHTLPFEPTIGTIQLKLDEQMLITFDTYKLLKTYLEDLRTHRIISFEDPVLPVEKVVEKQEQVKISAPKEKSELRTVIKAVEPKEELIQDIKEEIVEELKEEPTVEDVFKKTKRKK